MTTARNKTNHGTKNTAQNNANTAQVLRPDGQCKKKGNQEKSKPDKRRVQRSKHSPTHTRSSKTDTQHYNYRQNGLKYVANVPNNLAEKTMWTRSDWKDISTVFRTIITAQ